MNEPSQESPARYRLRFLLQEFDLPPGPTLIGRGEDCHITIFDPAISRRHARIFVDEQHALLEDLGSRNGCRVNGVPVKGQIALNDGDRIRIGTQELVLSEVKAATSQVIYRRTGSLCFCASCRAAYAKEMDACPHCGCTQRGPNPLAHGEGDAEEDTESLSQDRRYASGPP